MHTVQGDVCSDRISNSSDQVFGTSSVDSARDKIAEHLFELNLRGRLDRLRVRAAVAAQPLPDEPGLADAPPAEQNEQPAGRRGRIQFGQLALAIHERLHVVSLTC